MSESNDGKHASLELMLDPPADSWPRTMPPRVKGSRIRRFREQLGLPADAPIVMSGHQAQFWHPGILAKMLTGHAMARRAGAAFAWLVIDHDQSRPFQTRLPAIDERGRLRDLAWALDGEHAVHTSTPLDARATTPHPPAIPRGWSLDERVRASADALVRALANHAHAASAGAQVTRAMLDLLHGEDGVLRDVPPPFVVYATDLARTDLFAEIVEHSRRQPQSMHAIYNDAAARFPRAELRALRIDPDEGHELPLWKRAHGHGVSPLFESELADLPPEAMLPRALLTTGMLRLAGCELFIHGLGGREYEPANDAWLSRWLPEDWMRGAQHEKRPALAPFVTASADLTLDLPGDSVSPEDAARARWRAHRARHHPIEVGDADGQRRRDTLVSRIAAATRASHERRALYNELHGLLESHWHAHRDALRALDERADEASRAAAGADLRRDRTWPFCVHPPGSLAALRSEIDARF